VFIVLGYDLYPYQKGTLLTMDESINVFGEININNVGDGNE